MLTHLKSRLYQVKVERELLRDNGDFPPVAPKGGDIERTFIGTVGSAGQSYQWARALESARPSASATSMRFRRGGDTFKFLVDQSVPYRYAQRSKKWQRLQWESLKTYRAVIVESALPLIDTGHSSDVAVQIRDLGELGVSCALLFHGSDIRDPDRHRQAEPRSHFSVDSEFTQKMRDRVAISRKVIAEAGVDVFVSTPALLSEVENAQWLPIVIDVDAWHSEEEILRHSGPIRVVHAPSSSFIKGTELVEPMLWKMHELGEIEYVRVSGVPHAEMPRLYRSADVVLDHFRTGNYGVAAAEAMAAGRLCVSHVSDTVRSRTRELTGAELPIVQATPEDLREVILGLQNEPERGREIAMRGRSFVRRWHSGAKSGEILSNWLDHR